ncbi:MAG TPA: AAA family ATPase, partial [Bryobacteraceae bacterium]|nr:AAA family ATPase [Bryobacteraceae bacterium]
TSLDQVLDHAGIMDLRSICRQVLVAQHVRDYAVDMVIATQPGTSGAHELANRYIRYGSSPRGAQALVECGRVVALMAGRLNLSIDDVRSIAPAVLRHRIIMNFDAHADNLTPDSILNRILPSVRSVAAS